MKRIFLDIETLPPNEERRSQIARDVELELLSGSLPSDGDIVSKVTDERFRDLALKAEYGRVLAIGLIVEVNNQVRYHGLLGRNRSTYQFHVDEARTLKAFWDLLEDFDPRQDLIIGHNILEFDLPFIIKRSRITQEPPSLNLSFARYKSYPIYDTMWEWTCWKQHIKLSEVAGALGIDNPKNCGLDGSTVYDNYIAGNHQEIALYCMRDVETVRSIYYKMNFMTPPELKSYEAKSASIIECLMR